MTKEELQMLGFEIVAYAGDARSTLLKVLKEVRGGNFENTEAALKFVMKKPPKDGTHDEKILFSPCMIVK